MAGERAMFVIGSNFHPFTMQEQLVPFQMYKDAFERTEDAYMDLSQKADTFKYLSETLPEDSKARQIYEGYANGLAEQAEDLAQNGLSMANRRALTSYKRRYQGEIGRLNKADEALQEERKRRLALSSNDSSTLYANDNISIDDFLDNNKPNLYSVSGNDLYKRGLEIGASGSSRMYSDPEVSKVTKYYQDIFNTQGITPEAIAAFRRDLSTIPEFADAVTSTLKEKGVTDNLTGSNYERAKESVINGIVNGAIYKRNDSIQQNLGVLTAAQKESKREWGLEFNEKKREYDNSYELSKQELQLKQDAATASKANNTPKLKNPIILEFNGESPLKNSDRYKNGANVTSSEISDVDDVPSGQLMSYEDLPATVRDNVKIAISGRGKPTDYHYTWIHSTAFRDAKVVIIPNETSTTDFGSTGSVDIH